MQKINQLQLEGEEILKKTNLLTKLSLIGEAHLVGNMPFLTTIKPDIDIQIYPNSDFVSATDKITGILNSLGITDVIIRKLKISKKTLILAKYTYNEKIWNIDIALTNKSHDYTFDSYRYYLDHKDNFTEEKRQLIIDFKSTLCDNRLIFDNPSFYIYRGVIEENIQTLEEMKLYLEKVKEKMKKEKS